MDATKKLAGKTYRHFMHDSMKRNSSLLILSQATNAVCGFIFWIICARLFKASSVGLATAFISFGLLIATFTNLGLPSTVVRFLSSSKKQGSFFVACLSLVTIASFGGGFIALILIAMLAPNLSFINSSIFLSITLILLVVGMGISSLVDSTLIAFRKGEYIFSKAVITNLPRIILPFFLIFAGVKGITGIYTLMLLIGLSYGLFIILRKFLSSDKLQPTFSELKQHRSYVSSNYFGGMFGILPSTLAPIIILSRLGPESAAFFYMPMQITAFLSIICASISQTLISECSHTDNDAMQKDYFKKAFIHQYQLLIPVVALVILSAWPLLKIYGGVYAEYGSLPLIILASSSLIVGINWLGDTWLNIKKRNRAYFLMNAFNSLAVVTLVFLFSSHGLVAVAVGWLAAQSISAAVYLVVFARGHLLSFFRPT